MTIPLDFNIKSIRKQISPFLRQNFRLLQIILQNGQSDFADASTTYTCKAGFMDLLKTTKGVVNPEKNWSFALYYGPDGFGTTPIGTSSTSGDLDGLLLFDEPALRPDKTYTVCELGIAAGWTSFWQVNGATVVPYDPNANDPIPEYLGNRCVDFGYGTTNPAIPVTVGTRHALRC